MKGLAGETAACHAATNLKKDLNDPEGVLRCQVRLL